MIADRLRSRRGQLAAVGVGSLLLAITGIGSSDIGGDEAVTWWTSQLTWQDLGNVLSHQDMNFGPYYALMHIWTQVTTQLWWMRLPSALGAAATVVAVTGLTRHMMNARAAWIAALLTVLSLSWITFAQEARPYSWAAAIATSATSVFVAVGDRPTSMNTRSVAVYLVLMAILPLAHLFASMAGGIHLAFAASKKDARLVLLSATGILPGVAIGAVVAAQAKQVNQTVPTALDALKDIINLSATAWYVPVAGLALAGLVAYPWSSQGRRGRSDILMFVCWWFIPPALLWLLSITVTPVFAARYFLWTTPAMIVPAAGLMDRLLWGVQLRRAGAVAVRSGVLLLVIGLTAMMIPKQVQVRSASGHFWRAHELADVISHGYSPSDALIAPEYGVRFPVQYYLSATSLPPQPLVTADPRVAGTYDPPAISGYAENSILANYSRVWVLSTPGTMHQVPSGFCEERSWVSEFHIAELTLAARC